MKRCEVLVVGGGPAGMCAAAEAARCGAETLLVEDKHKPGGQLLKQTHMFFGGRNEYAGTRGFEIADILEKEVREAGVTVMTDTTVTGIFDGRVVGMTTEKEYFCVEADRIVVATGAMENSLLFENADLPGVYGAGGVQTLMNVEGVLPGRRFVMIGAGNIGLIVSYQLLQAGAEVICVAEAAPKIGGYEVHAAKLRRLRVPILLEHTVVRVEGEEHVERAVLARVENFAPIAGTEFAVACDCVCVAVGLSPLTELLAQAGCRMEFVAELGGYAAWHDRNMRTSLENVYVAGDASGIEEASTAMLEGRIAGISAAVGLQKGGAGVIERRAELRKRLEKLRGGPFGAKPRAGKAHFWGEEPPASKILPRKEPPPTPEKGRFAVINCPQPIPCDPCVDACPQGAIKIDGDMNNLPYLDVEKCTGCGTCLAVCPGLAIRLYRPDADETEAEIGVPYEMLPVPEPGQKVAVVDDEGRLICEGRVSDVRSSKKFGGKRLVFFRVPKEFGRRAAGFAPPGREGGIVIRHPAEKSEADVLVCRCEDVWRSEIEKLVEAGYDSFDRIKRVLRCGMGPCQGRTCQRLVLGILARARGVSPASLRPQTARSPIRPTKLAVFASGHLEDGKK